MPNQTPDMMGYRMIQKALVFCSCLIVTTIIAVFLLSLNASQGRCEEIQDIRTYILGAANRGIEATPTIDYYKNHPEELEEALKTLRGQRDEFLAPLDCSLI